MATKDKNLAQQPYQQLMVLFSSYVVALREQEFSEETQMRILAKTTSALTKIYTTEVLSKPRKRQGVFRAASTPFGTAKKVPPDQRVQFSAEEVKILKNLNDQIGSKLYSAGISAEQFMSSLAKGGRITLTNLNEGLAALNLVFSSEERDLLLRKFNSQIDLQGRVNYSEFTHLFPDKSKGGEQEGKEETTESEKSSEGEKKRGDKPKRALTLNPFPQTIHLKNESDSERSSSRISNQEADDMSEDDEISEDRDQTPPRDTEED